MATQGLDGLRWDLKRCGGEVREICESMRFEEVSLKGEEEKHRGSRGVAVRSVAGRAYISSTALHARIKDTHHLFLGACQLMTWGELGLWCSFASSVHKS